MGDDGKNYQAYEDMKPEHGYVGGLCLMRELGPYDDLDDEVKKDVWTFGTHVYEILDVLRLDTKLKRKGHRGIGGLTDKQAKKLRKENPKVDKFIEKIVNNAQYECVNCCL